MPLFRIYNSLGEEIKRFSSDDYGETFTVGRSRSCNISLSGKVPNTVSRHHMTIIDRGTQFIVRTEVPGGIAKDGVKMPEVIVKEGSIIRFGPLFLGVGETGMPTPYDITWEVQTPNHLHRAVLWPGDNPIGASAENYVMVRAETVSRFHGILTVHPGGKVMYRAINEMNNSQIDHTTTGNSLVELKVGSTLTMGAVPVKLVKAVRVAKRDTLQEVQSAIANQRAFARQESQKTKRILTTVIVVSVIILIIFILLAVLSGM